MAELQSPPLAKCRRLDTDIEPWNPDSEQGMGLVRNSPFYRTIINNHSVLTDNVQIDQLWSKMIEYHIVDQNDKERIQQYGARIDQVDKLLDRLTKGPMCRLHAFFKVLMISGHKHLLQELGIKTEVYTDKLPRKSVSTETSQLLERKDELLELVKKRAHQISKEVEKWAEEQTEIINGASGKMDVLKLPKLELVNTNFDEFKANLLKCTSNFDGVTYDDSDDDDEYPDQPPFPLPPLPKELQDRLTPPPTKGQLLCKSSGPVFADIAWFKDGSLLAGDEHGKAAWRITFSPDYKHVTSRTKLHSGSPAKRVNTCPDGGWGFCDEDESLLICKAGDQEPSIWDPGYKVRKVTLTEDQIILETARSLHVYNKDRKFMYEKCISSETLQFMDYESNSNTMVFTAGGNVRYLYICDLSQDSAVYRIRRFSEEKIKFKFPRGLCVDQSCRIFVPDSEAKAIYVFDREGRYLHKLCLDKPRNLKPWSLSILEQPGRKPILAVIDGWDILYLYELS